MAYALPATWHERPCYFMQTPAEFRPHRVSLAFKGERSEVFLNLADKHPLMRVLLYSGGRCLKYATLMAIHFGPA